MIRKIIAITDITHAHVYLIYAIYLTEMETHEIIASLDALAAGFESEQNPVLARLDALGESRIVAATADGMTRRLLDLERSTHLVPPDRRQPLLQIHEALALTRLNGELVHADTLLLADLERTHSRIVGPIGTGLRALRALRALDDPHTPSLETAFLHLDRDVTEWPANRDADPRVASIRTLVAQIETIVEADAPALARLYDLWRCIMTTSLPRPSLAGTAADDGMDLPGDDALWLRKVETVGDSDPRRMFCALALSWGAARVGWTARRDLCVAAALRAISHPPSDRADQGLSWMGQVIAQAAEQTRLEIVRLGHALEQIQHDAGGSRDRSRSVLIDCLCARPVTTTAQLAADAGVTRPPALRFLNRLAAGGGCRWKGMRETGRVLEAVRLLE